MEGADGKGKSKHQSKYCSIKVKNNASVAKT
jgi:hypothetical protein